MGNHLIPWKKYESDDFAGWPHTHKEYVDFEEKNVSLGLLICLFSSRREPLFMVYVYIKNNCCFIKQVFFFLHKEFVLHMEIREKWKKGKNQDFRQNCPKSRKTIEKPLMTYLKKGQSALIFFCSIPFILHKALDKSPPQPKMLSSENEGVDPVATYTNSYWSKMKKYALRF